MASASRKRCLMRLMCRCGVAIPRVDLLLKRMQDVQDAFKPDGVDRPVGIAVKTIADFQHPAQALERFGIARMFAKLHFEKSLADLGSHGRREGPQILSARADEDRGFDRAQQVIHAIIVIYL